MPSRFPTSPRSASLFFGAATVVLLVSELSCSTNDGSGGGGLGAQSDASTSSGSEGSAGSGAAASGAIASGDSGGGSATSGSMRDGMPDATSGSDGGSGGSGSGTSGVADGGGSGSSGAVACARQPLCDDFESYAAGMLPNGGPWQLITGNTPGTPNGPVPGGGSMVGIDTSQHHSGVNSLRVVGGDSSGWYAANKSAFSKTAQQIYVRLYARFSGDPSSDGGVATQGHNGFLSMWSGPAATAADPLFFSKYYSLNADNTGQLRVGFQAGVVDWNSVLRVSNGSQDSTLPDLSPTGIAQSVSPRAKEWNCYEFHIDETNNHIEFWFNSTKVPGLSWDGTDVPQVSDQWTRMGPPPLSIQSLGLGWLQLGTAETAWYDDVVVSSSRVGCQ
ncbi:MAG: hypothetical protein M3O36_19830 [Myxococcota bacterium]|nr:hypothetical protein [Myxococcota bacterium]